MSCTRHKKREHAPVDPFLEEISSRFPDFRPDKGYREVVEKYPALATPYYLSIARGPSMADPVFRQLMPSANELTGQGQEDPVKEAGSSPVPGLVHRFEGRALLLVTDGCFVRCRHCMRKRMWRETTHLDGLWPRVCQWKRWLSSRTDVNEAVLSGGDPLTLGDVSLARLLRELSEVHSVKKVRVHTRAPVVAPQRVSPALARLLSQNGVRRLVTQYNHPCEMTPASLRAVSLLQKNEIRVMNQAVLLKGVNDAPAILAALFTMLERNGIENYYLHHPDPVKGAYHFRLLLERGLAVYEEAIKSAPGIAPPRYVLDLPDRGKTEVKDIIKDTSPITLAILH